VAPSVEPVVVDEVVGVGALGPALRYLVQLVGEDADGNGMVMALASKKSAWLSQQRRPRPGVGKPVEGDAVHEVVAGEVALVRPLEDLGDQAGLTGPVAVVEHEGCEIDRRVGQPVQRLGAGAP